MRDWLGMSAGDLGRGIETGGIDPRDLARAFLDAIDGHRFATRIYARTTPDRASAEAAAAADRAKRGLRRGPLDGVPVSWKDLFDTAGVETEAGSALLTGRVPDGDARVLTAATRAGLVCLGKTHMTELAFSGLGLNPITASPPCVNDEDAVSGGSSSGAATSVAFGLAPAAIGSDTGGSVRIPAAWNDLVGLKTRHGRLSLDGVVPLCPSFDTVGPLCRTVEDASLLLAALSDGKSADLSNSSLSGLRMLVLETVAFDDIEDAPRVAFEAAVETVGAAGAEILRGTVPQVAEAMPLSRILFAPEAYGTWRETIEGNPEVMFPEILERFRGGREIPAWEYVAGWQTLTRLRAEYAASVAGFDAVILPSCPIRPPSARTLATDGEAYKTANLMTLRNTRIANLMGLAAVTLPTGAPSCGITLQGPVEERLLRVAAAVERALS